MFWNPVRNLPADPEMIRCLFSLETNRKGEKTEKKWPVRGWEVKDCTDDGKRYLANIFLNKQIQRATFKMFVFQNIIKRVS